jgi:hypothetical protein
MTKHHTLWMAGRSTCINQNTTHSWLLFCYYCINFLIFDICAQIKERLVSINSRIFCKLIWDGFNTPCNYSFYLWQSIDDAHVKLKLLKSVNHNNLCFRMLSLVMTCFWSICDIYSRNNVIMKKSTPK